MKFAIYKYELTKSNQQELFKDGESVWENAQSYLDSLLDVSQLNLYHTKKNGDTAIYPNDILKVRQGVALLHICNLTQVSIWDKYKERREVSKPFCRVIIDNRPGVAQMAIERTGAFDGNPDKVRNILQESLHALLAPAGLSIEIRAKMRVKNFWDTVEEQMRKKDERVKRVVFEFPDPDRSEPVDAPPSMIEHLRFLRSLSSAMGAARSSYKMEATRKGTLTLERTREDLAQMVSLCCNNGYQISVYFHRMGVFRYGERVRALFDIDEDTLTDFINGQYAMGNNSEGTLTYALIETLDNIREQTKEYNDATQTDERRKRTHRHVV